jgi:imidazolonepropionase-like amidohydrolase
VQYLPIVRQSLLFVMLAWLIAATLRADAAEATFTAFPDTAFAIEHVELTDGLGTPVRRDWTVVVENGTITSVGPSAATAVAQGVRVIDGRGKSLTPGIVGMHEHLYYETNARETVDFWTSRGVTSFKAFLALTRDELKAVIVEAHARGALVAGHLCSITIGEAADLGIDELEHGIVQSSDFVDGKVPDVCPSFSALFKSWASLQPDDPRVAALIQKLVARHVAVTSTLAVLESGFGLAPPLKRRELSLLNGDARNGYEPARSDAPQLPAKVASHILNAEMEFERAFVAQGGLLTEGADAGAGVIPGFADQREIESLVAAGFTPLQAIEIATANGARALHRFDRIGSIERSRRAGVSP